MRSLSRRAVVGLLYVCGAFALMLLAVGVVGISGVRSSARVSTRIVGDELASATATARLGRAIDRAHVEGDEVFLSTDRTLAQQRERDLYDVALPTVEVELTNVDRLHAGDDATEKAGIDALDDQWVTVRDRLRPVQHTGPVPARAAELDKAAAALDVHLTALIAREKADAASGERQTDATSTTTTWVVIGVLLVAILAAAAISRAGVRLIRRAVQPENEQVEFAEALQVTESEREAHELIKRHLERAIPGVRATVLNKNNSADRLEAMTEIAADSCLATTLQQAAPRSCLAIRSGRSHLHDDRRKPLLSCSVCGDCPGGSSCTPFTVSGEVIGAVLVTGPSLRTETEERRVRDSVSQAAPALANLRNLAIAELRAETDSLTGLPNKRSVADTLKRMVAHAARTLTPLSLLMIDLDHFKNINDRLGHPVGDQALASVGAAIASALRASDFAGRNGGEEFVVLLPETAQDGASEAAEKIRAAIAAIEVPGSDLPLTASLGIAVYPEHATSAERLERLADAALYTAKRGGRNRFEIADPHQDHPLVGTDLADLPI